MRICMFGAYQHDDERNRIFFKALQSADLACVECHSRLPSTSRRYRQLYQRYQEVAQDGVDAIYVGKIGHGDVPLAWALGRRYGVPVFFDAFVSMFDTYVNDRQRHGRYSAKALYYYLLDYQAAHLAQHVVLDTTAHIDYFARTFHVNRHKFRLLPIGADDTVFFPQQDPAVTLVDTPLSVLFIGTYIPLHGVDVILRAAKILQTQNVDVTFRLLGKGQTYPAMRRMATDLDLVNVRFEDPVPLEELPMAMAGADILLGIFGVSNKAHNVVPNKAYQAIAMRKPLITADTPASREVFTQRQDAFLCPPGDPVALAGAVKTLCEDPQLRQSIAQQGYDLFQRSFSIAQIGVRLKAMLQA